MASESELLIRVFKTLTAIFIVIAAKDSILEFYEFRLAACLG